MRGGGHIHNLNSRGAFLHVVGDLLGSVGAIVAALIMLVTGWYLADPLLSVGIDLLMDDLHVLLRIEQSGQGPPRHPVPSHGRHDVSRRNHL